jgi:hypothetical protein
MHGFLKKGNFDDSNFARVIMHERGLDLQAAIDILTTMLVGREGDYAMTKSALLSFGLTVDAHVARYLAGCTHRFDGITKANDASTPSAQSSSEWACFLEVLEPMKFNSSAFTRESNKTPNERDESQRRT